MPTHVANIKSSVSGAPGTGSITLLAALAGASTFTAADDGGAFDCKFEDGTAWEIAYNCIYTHVGTALTRGTFQASSTGAALSLSAASIVESWSVSRVQPYIVVHLWKRTA